MRRIDPVDTTDRLEIWAEEFCSLRGFLDWWNICHEELNWEKMSRLTTWKHSVMWEWFEDASNFRLERGSDAYDHAREYCFKECKRRGGASAALLQADSYGFMSTHCDAEHTIDLISMLDVEGFF